ncbi:MAG: restriction endonuclease, partial [Wenzhouxiangella sp.]
EGLQKVISVAMLSEGWDAKNVTHIMGLRAFTSQLLCEQVIGRGLRRVSHDRDENGLFKPEYVNVFGVPLSIFQDVGDSGEAPDPPRPSRQIQSLPERNALEIRWPNVIRVDTVIRPTLKIDWDQVEVLELDPARTPIAAELAPALGAGTNMQQVRKIDLEAIPESFRLQRLTFRAARKVFDELKDQFTAEPTYLITQLVRLVEEFIASDRLQIPSDYHSEPLRRRILLSLNIDRIVQHLQRHLYQHNSERQEPVFDEENPMGS